MTTPRGTVLFQAGSDPRATFEWSIGEFLQAAHDSKTWEDFKARLIGRRGDVHFARTSPNAGKKARAAAGGIR